MEQNWRKEYIASTNEYIKETNQHLGLAAFTVGVACIGKGALYAWLGLALLSFVWYSRFAAYKYRLDVLRAIGHEAMHPTSLLLKCIPAVVGWLFLGTVALGIVK